MGETSLDLLGTDSNGKPFKAWHREYKCSGIKQFEFADERVLGICPAYDDVVLEDIPKLAQESSATVLASRVELKIKAKTEAFFNAFRYN